MGQGDTDSGAVIYRHWGRETQTVGQGDTDTGVKKQILGQGETDSGSGRHILRQGDEKQTWGQGNRGGGTLGQVDMHTVTGRQAHDIEVGDSTLGQGGHLY